MNQVAVVASEAEPTAVISDSSPDAYAPAGAALPVAPSTVPDAPAMPSAGEPTPPASLGAQAIVPDAPASQAPTPVSAQPYRQPYQPSAPPAQTGYAAGDYAAEEAPAEPTPAASPPAYGYAPGTAAPQVSAPQVSPSVPAAQYEPNWAGGYDRSVSPPAARAEEVVERRQNTGVYYVEPGDSFWKISQKLYGTGGYFKALQAHNRDRFPNPADLDIGDEIATPTADELRAKYSGLCPKQRTAQPGTPQVRAVSTLAARPSRPYVVEEGDTLYDIAKYELGDARRWPEIFQLNRDALSVDIDYLRPGTKILLPVEANQPADMLTRQPGETLRR
jgi:nucleoid-associated protein YgaU